MRPAAMAGEKSEGSRSEATLRKDRISNRVLSENIFPPVALFFLYRFAIIFPRKIARKIFWEYVFKLIEAGIAQQQNCLKIGPYRCHDCGM
jgi:hypothetical protein